MTSLICLVFHMYYLLLMVGRADVAESPVLIEGATDVVPNIGCQWRYLNEEGMHVLLPMILS
jgi:hypothetical protein